MTRFDKAIAALADPKNEPLRWLIGDALKQHAEKTVGSHFLLDTLSDVTRKPFLVGLNARFHQFRELLQNPDQAPIKARADLQCGKRDAEQKLTDFLAEVMAVVHLHSLGYVDFHVVLPNDQPSPDFMAHFKGHSAAIEVKNLREPADILRTVAARHWKEIAEAEPERYNFHAVLRCQHRGKLTAAAQQRLRTILAQIPEIKKNPYTETLDGGITISIERPIDVAGSSPEAPILNNLTFGNKPRLVIVSSFRAEDLSTDVSEVQALFLKSLRIVADATPKFFSKSYNPAHLNVIALHWEPPKFICSPDVLTYTNEHIEKLFKAFDLQLKPIVFRDPELPWPLLRQYE